MNKNNKTVVYIDFDGTISRADVMNLLLEKFADPVWKEYDSLWSSGSMPSSECIKKQIKLLDRIDTNRLFETINDVVIDESFGPFVDFCNQSNVEVQILSDGLDFYINHLLDSNGIKINNIRSNKYLGNGNVYFPYYKYSCEEHCANCKSHHIENNLFSIYVGDGKSDFCAARKCNLVFAKAHLAKLFQENKIDFIKFDKFSDIVKELRHFWRNI